MAGPLPPGDPPSARDREPRRNSCWLEPVPRLLDDRSRPGFREAYGALALRATGLDVALTHIRLATLDLSEAELARMRRVRLLLAEVSAVALDAEASAVLHRPKVADNLRRLGALLHLGRIEVRSAPLGGWAPDFSVFRDRDGFFALLVGPHRFDPSTLHCGPELASLHGAAAATTAAQRFGEIWERGHDISPAIAGILARADPRVRSPKRETGPDGGWAKTQWAQRFPAQARVDTPPGQG